MNQFLIYLLTRLDYLEGFFTFIAFACGIYFLSSSIYYHIGHEWDDKLKKPAKKYMVMCVGFALLSCLTPTRNEAIVIIVGGKAIDYVEKDKNLQKIPLKATEIITQYMDKTLVELKEEKK